MWLFLLFVAVPIVEIGLFIQVGGALGLWPTLAIVVLTAFAGTILMRAQGMAALAKLQSSLAEGQNPADPLAQGAMILFAGMLLLTPGFFTDAVGFLLLLPSVRLTLMRWLSAKVVSGGFVFKSANAAPQKRQPTNDTIDGDYSVLNDNGSSPSENPSGWTNN